VARKPIKKGDMFSEDNLTVKRPGTGISAMEWDELLGQVSKQKFKPDDLIII
jgi:N,N'-diacetyllegionaminate synthase